MRRDKVSLKDREGGQEVSLVTLTTSKASNPSGRVQGNVRCERTAAQEDCCSPARPFASLYAAVVRIQPPMPNASRGASPRVK